MFSRIRKRLTYTNVIMTLALVFAMSGGALAASKYLITSTKQISPKVLTALKGKNGKNGTDGAQGPVGEKGAAGTNGTPGTNGKDGVGAQGPEGPMGPIGTTGTPGAKGTTGTPGAKGTTGATGATGPQGPLQSQKSETGAWSYSFYTPTTGTEEIFVSISFTLPLQTALSWLPPEAAVTHYVLETGKTAECPGTAANPEAKPGNLCVYQVNAEHVAHEPSGLAEVSIFPPDENFATKFGTSTTGALLKFERIKAETEGKGWGTWAVTEK